MSIIGKAVEWTTQGKEQTCEACGGVFMCGPLMDGGCWCMREKVAPEKLDEIKGQYERCLCPECLRKAALEQAP